MMRGKRALLSATVFAMFFGAGNLIFPPYLGYRAGGNAAVAFLGFAVTAIGLPVLALTTIGRAGSAEKLASRVHPLFGLAFTVAIYLAIGPCLAIPRTASTSYEMAAEAFGNGGKPLQILYSIVFFALGGIVALKPEKLTRRLGKILAPVLVLLILSLFLGSLFSYQGGGMAAPPYDEAPFTSGFQDGYQTMDALAGLVFGIILSVNVKALGIDGEREGKEGIIAAAGGGLLLLAVYAMITFIGITASGYSGTAANGAEVLSFSASMLYGKAGMVILALIFMIACFDTAVSLLSSTGEYFHALLPKVSRGIWIALFAALSCAISNMGLDTIISISSPVLSVLYPAAILLMALSVLPCPEALPWTHRTGIIAALASSTLSASGIWGGPFSWVLPSILGSAIGFIIDRRK